MFDPGDTIPAIQADQLAGLGSAGTHYVLLDVREAPEIPLANLNALGALVVPLSQLAQRGLEVLPEQVRDPDIPVVVFCHHGIRSAQVVAWLLANGWRDVRNLTGGIDAYARRIDPTIGFY